MEAALKELTKLEKLTNGSSSKGKTVPILTALDDVQTALLQAKQQCQSAGYLSPDNLAALAKSVEAGKKSADERQKETYSAMSRMGKAIDKARRATVVLL